MAPSSVCSAIRTTVRTKFGSRKTGDARISLPRSDSAIPALCLPAVGLGLLLRLGLRARLRRGPLLGGLLLLGARLGADRGLLLALLGGRGRGAVDARGADHTAGARGGAGAAVLVGGHDRDPQATPEILAGDRVVGARRAVDVLPPGGDQPLPLVGVAGGRV